jgi:hypothetical protein
MVDVQIRFVDFMDARPLPRATLDVLLTVVPLFPVLPDGPGPPQPPRPDDRFAEVLTLSAVTDADGRARVSFDDAAVFQRLSGLTVPERRDRSVDAVATLSAGAAFFGIRFEPQILAGGLRRDANVAHALPADLGMAIVGHTTADTARLWFHLPFDPAPGHTFSCAVTTRPVNTPAGPPALLPGPVGGVPLGRSIPVGFELRGRTAAVDVDGLTPGGTHDYALLAQRGARQFVLATGRFRTPADPQSRVDFAFGSCHLPVVTGTPDRPSEEARRSLEMWQRLADRRDFEALLLIGDQIYGDGIEDKWPEDDDFTRYLRRYRQLWAYRPMREVLRSVPTYMILDDHDVADDFGIGDLDDNKVVGAMRAYELFQHRHNPGTLDPQTGLNVGPLHYSFRWGPAAFFVMDGRTKRKDEGSPVFGRDQLRDLRRWAAGRETRAADVIFFVAPVPLALLPTETIRKIVDELTDQAAVTAGVLGGLGLGLSLSALGLSPFPGVGGAVTTAVVLGALGFAAAEVVEDFVDRGLLLKADLGERWDLRDNQPDLIALLDLLFDLANGVGEDPPRKRAVFILSGDIHAATMHGIRSLPEGAGRRHAANPVITQLTSSALSREPVNSTLWVEAVSRASEDLDLDLKDINLLTLYDERGDWEGLSSGVVDVEDVFGDGKGEYFLDPNHDRRYLAQYAGLLMERTLGRVRVERRDPVRRRYRIRLLIEGQSGRTLDSTLDVDLDAPSATGLTFQPESLAFGSAAIGAVQRRTVTIENAAGARVDVSIPRSPSGSPFRWPALAASLDHGDQRRLEVEFRPATTAVVRATVTVTSTAPGSPRRIDVVGKGSGGFPEPGEEQPPRVLKVTPSLISFGSLTVGSVATRTITIENATGDSVTLSVAAPPPGSRFSWQPFSGTLPNGAKRTVTVQFGPVPQGISQGKLTVTSSAPGSPHRVGLAGKSTGGF